MNRILSAALVLSLAAPLAAFAQQDQQPPAPIERSAPQSQPQDQQGFPHHHHRAPDPQREAAMLSRRLNLNADQTAKLEPILAGRQQKMQVLFANNALTPQDRHAQIRAIHQDTEQQLASVLTPDQLQQMKSMRHGRHAHRGPDGAPGSNPTA